MSKSSTIFLYFVWSQAQIIYLFFAKLDGLHYVWKIFYEKIWRKQEKTFEYFSFVYVYNRTSATTTLLIYPKEYKYSDGFSELKYMLLFFSVLFWN